MITLQDVLDEQFKETVFDKRFIDHVYKYQVAFVNRNSEHLEFFGSNLIGVHAIRFRVADTLKFYKDVADVDYTKLEKALKSVTTIVQEFKITSDALNLTLMYMLHRVLTSPKLSASQKERGAYDLALVFFYRCIAIRQSDYFHFPADPRIAQAAYGELSNKFLIKKVGSWKGVMEYRAKELIDPKGIHFNNLLLFKDDMAITYAISDSENRIRDLYKNYYAVFHKTYTEGGRVSSTSATMLDVEGEEVMREKINSVEKYVTLTRQCVVDKVGFVKPELVDVVIDINANTSNRMLTHTLNWISESYNNPKWHARIDTFLSLIVVHSFHLLNETGSSELKDYPSVLTSLKNLYLSTRSSDKELLEIRKEGEVIVKAANGKTNNSLSMATRTAVILYVTLRALTLSSKH